MLTRAGTLRSSGPSGKGSNGACRGSQLAEGHRRHNRSCASTRRTATRLELDAADYGVPGDRVRVVIVGSGDKQQSFTTGRNPRREVTLPPRTAVAWELSPP